MTMIEIPSELLEAAGMTPEEVKTELALVLFRQGRIRASQFRAMANDSLRLVEAFQKPQNHEQIDLDTFISWAAHDLRSPLNTMIGFTKVVLKGIDGPVNELQATDLDSAHNSSQRMLTMINNLIDMARLNKGELRVEMIPGDLFPTIVDATTRWKTDNPTRQLQTEIDQNFPIFSFDPGRLRQVLIGLLTFSANHVSDGGKVILTARKEFQDIRFNISSSGEKARDKYEMDLTMLGFICSGLIRLHGGFLDVGMDTGHGLALTFTLPLAD